MTLVLYKNICHWYSFEMSTNDICFYKEVEKNTLAVI